MSGQLPPNRLPKCILLTKETAWLLREVVKPWGVPSHDGKPTEKFQHFVWQFCERLYESLLHIELEGRAEWNMELAYEDCFVINQLVKAGMVDGILIQTWMALHELNQESAPLELPGATVVLEVWEVRDAILETSGSVETGRAKPARTRKPRGAQLPVDPNGPEVPEAKGG